MRVFLTSLFLFFLNPPAHAETVYVTDFLRLNIYDNPGAQANVVKTVTSGTALTVLERNTNYTKVKLEDGSEGWTKSAYLVTDKPPRLVVTEMESKLKNAQTGAQNARQEADRLQAELQQFRQTDADRTKQETDLTKNLEKLQKQVGEYEDLVVTYENSVPMSLFALTALICLVLGFAGGWYWIDSRIRRRHGGFRIY